MKKLSKLIKFSILLFINNILGFTLKGQERYIIGYTVNVY
jgi:uncharacterized membrane protein required for colicin V production